MIDPSPQDITDHSLRYSSKYDFSKISLNIICMWHNADKHYSCLKECLYTPRPGVPIPHIGNILPYYSHGFYNDFNHDITISPCIVHISFSCYLCYPTV